jgi:Rho-binding antiterminator
MNQEYKNISCDFYDELEALATLHKECEIEFWSENATKSIIHDKIKNLYTKEGVEYMETAKGTVIRLDKLIKVDGKKPLNRC